MPIEKEQTIPHKVIQKAIHGTREECDAFEERAIDEFVLEKCADARIGELREYQLLAEKYDIELADILLVIEQKYSDAGIITKQPYYDSFCEIASQWKPLGYTKERTPFYVRKGNVGNADFIFGQLVEERAKELVDLRVEDAIRDALYNIVFKKLQQ